MGRTRNKHVLQNENYNQDPLKRANFSQDGISCRGPYLWNRIITSENLAFSDKDSHQGFKYQLKRFFFLVDLHHLRSTFFQTKAIRIYKNDAYFMISEMFMKLVDSVLQNHIQILVIRFSRSSSFQTSCFNLTSCILLLLLHFLYLLYTFRTATEWIQCPCDSQDGDPCDKN